MQNALFNSCHCERPSVWQTKKKGALEQLITQQRKELERKDAEMKRLQRLNKELSEQVN